ncbi:hypothetical protein ABT186_36420 [Streptomyces sp. NPDC001634]|uniref:beta family protein n=1 Tax=Streptomyces sp. NPDC001634 TaxID=3154390 RepID=UPI00331F26EC
MVRTVYVPVLPTTRAARRAYEHVDVSVRHRIEPLWTVVPRVGPERLRDAPPVSDPETDETLLRDWLTPRMDDLIETMGDNPGWVDAAHVERLIHGSADSLWHLAVRSRLRLVTGPERDPRHQRYAADLAFLSGRSLGIRLPLQKPPDPHGSLRPQLLGLIDRLCLPPSRLDLILDIGPVTDAGEAAKTALIAIDLLGALVPWRTLVLTAGAFPRVMDDIDVQPTRTAVRHDWWLHHLVRTARPELARRIVYGDYSVEHACSANTAPVRQPGPGWSLLRYTTPDGFLIARAPTRGPDHVSRVRAQARWIVEHNGFRELGDPGHAEGERWLRDCAYGDGSKGSGNAETWLQAGHTQHMDFVARLVTGAL